MAETPLLVGLLFGAACYLILQASFVRVLFGFVLLSNAANLLVLAMSARPNGKTAPVLLRAGEAPVDPLPQALILTAIVIGFGVLAYLVMLLYRLFLDHRTADVRELFAPSSTPRPPPGGES
jgi:multisubunit Na+/H+ antiporter MnhC subunit